MAGLVFKNPGQHLCCIRSLCFKCALKSDITHSHTRLPFPLSDRYAVIYRNLTGAEWGKGLGIGDHYGLGLPYPHPTQK
jgi:hypothetical protein